MAGDVPLLNRFRWVSLNDFHFMSTDQDQARLIAERVARRVAGTNREASPSDDSTARANNGAPVSEELSAIREGLHDLENKLERIESKIVHNPIQPAEPARARLIDFVSSGPPVAVSPSKAKRNAQSSRAESPAITAPCAVRADFNQVRRVKDKGRSLIQSGSFRVWM